MTCLIRLVRELIRPVYTQRPRYSNRRKIFIRFFFRLPPRRFIFDMIFYVKQTADRRSGALRVYNNIVLISRENEKKN